MRSRRLVKGDWDTDVGRTLWFAASMFALKESAEAAVFLSSLAFASRLTSRLANLLGLVRHVHDASELSGSDGRALRSGLRFAWGLRTWLGLVRWCRYNGTRRGWRARARRARNGN
jgi:hypothetical protein